MAEKNIPEKELPKIENISKGYLRGISEQGESGKVEFEVLKAAVLAEIEIGGTNLRTGGKILSTLLTHPSAGNAPTANAEWTRFALPFAGSASEIYDSVRVSTIKGCNYTASVRFRTDATAVSVSRWGWMYGSSAVVNAPIVVKKLNETDYVAYSTFKASETAANLRTMNLRGISITGGTYIEFAYHKVEKGNIPTDWSPAAGE